MGGWGEIAQAIPTQPPKILHLPTPKFFYNTKCQDPLRPQHPVFSKFHLSPVMFFGQTPVLGPTPYAEPSPHLKRYRVVVPDLELQFGVHDTDRSGFSHRSRSQRQGSQQGMVIADAGFDDRARAVGETANVDLIDTLGV